MMRLDCKQFILLWSFCVASGWGVGVQNIGPGTLNEVKADGAIVLDGTHVLSETRVDGSLVARKAELNSLMVNGSAVLEESQVKGKTAVDGALTAKKVTFADVQVNGGAELTNSTVKGQTNIDGGLNVQQGEFGALNVNGGVSLSQTYIKGEAVINGGLVARDTSFEKHLSVAAEKMEFHHAKLSSLHVQNTGKRVKVQQVLLKGNTLVKGDIMFDENGEVLMEAGAKIQGTVKNGKIVAL
ncbi:hypothetical protein IM40_06390 [Candidatus Paracaedimonas acanthamoebae]|nr:hypothetical protein IM40_06390 [Candidatus Paracaedimonas acanthamoebae]